MSIETLKTLSKQPVRHPIATVKIAWSDTSIENTIVTPLTPVNRAHITDQIVTGLGNQKAWAFCETDDPLESIARLDSMYAMPNVTAGTPYHGNFLVGWWGDGTNISDANGYFDPCPHIRIEFYPIPFSGYEIRGYLPNMEYPVDFDLVLTHGNGLTYTHEVRGNSSVNYVGQTDQIKDVYQIDLYIIKWSHRGAFVKITALLSNYTNSYMADDIVSLSLLEETDGSLGTLPIGNISSNELTLSLQNLEDKYFFGNTASLLSNSARTNRRIEPSLGFDNELIPKGVYWCQDWTITDQGTTATTTALDRLGLLQDVQYNGVGNINNLDADGEATFWKNKNLYFIATEILTDLRDSYMPDLEFEIDSKLKETTVPLAFFKTQSYFDVIKTIAQAGCGFAYMDTPTDEERESAAVRGNTRCADILRIKPLETFIYTAVNMEAVEEIGMDDIITKTASAKKSDVVNIVTVNYTQYEIVDDKPKEVEDSTKSFTVQSDASILEFGKIKFEYGNNNLIQTLEHATDIATRILSAFSKTPYMAEISMFGDVTRRVGDILRVPEYQKHGIDTRGYYAVTRVSTDYDGGLRQSITCRRVTDAIFDISELGNADIDIDENGIRVNENIEQGGEV